MSRRTADAQPVNNVWALNFKNTHMSLNKCALTGRDVRLGAHKVTINKRTGVFHYIAYMRSGEIPTGDWTSCELKPYNKDKGIRQWAKLVAKWNEANPP